MAAGTRLRLAALLAAGAIAGCGGDDTEPAPTVAEPSPPPAKDGDRDGAPAVGDGEGGVELRQIGEFEQPLYITQPAGKEQDLFVVEQCGTVRIVREGRALEEPFLDLSDAVTCGGEQGLLSIAFAPDYGRTGLLYAHYTDRDGDGRIVELRRSAEARSVVDRESERELLVLEDQFSNHNGGLLLFGPDDLLYAGVGDGGGAGDPLRSAQDLGSLFGKILRIDPRPADGRPYRIPPDNPHVNDPEARAEIAVHGLRNPWRFSFDRRTGDLWIGDVGQDSLEEIDSAPAAAITGRDGGLNFGWSAFEGTERFNEDQSAPGARPPVRTYPLGDACAVTGGYVVRDTDLRSLYGRYLYADFCIGELRSFTAHAGRKATDDRALGPSVGSLSSFGEDNAGHLYVTSLDGPVYRLAPGG